MSMSHVQLNPSSPSPGPPLVHGLRARLLSTQDVHMARLQTLGQSRQDRVIIRVRGCRAVESQKRGRQQGYRAVTAGGKGLGAPRGTHTGRSTRVLDHPSSSRGCANAPGQGPQSARGTSRESHGQDGALPSGAWRRPEEADFPSDFPGEMQAGGDQTSSQVPAQGTAGGMKQASCLSKWPPA